MYGAFSYSEMHIKLAQIEKLNNQNIGADRTMHTV